MSAERTPGNANVCFRCPARRYDYTSDSASCDGTMNGREPFHCPNKGSQQEDPHAILRRRINGERTF